MPPKATNTTKALGRVQNTLIASMRSPNIRRLPANCPVPQVRARALDANLGEELFAAGSLPVFDFTTNRCPFRFDLDDSDSLRHREAQVSAQVGREPGAPGSVKDVMRLDR
jgi:hypothetical protein